MMTPLEINRLGYKALIDALGFDGMIRFLRQFELGLGDYTQERHQWLDRFTVEDSFTDLEQAREGDEPDRKWWNSAYYALGQAACAPVERMNFRSLAGVAIAPMGNIQS